MKSLLIIIFSTLVLSGCDFTHNKTSKDVWGDSDSVGSSGGGSGIYDAPDGDGSGDVDGDDSGNGSGDDSGNGSGDDSGGGSGGGPGNGGGGDMGGDDDNTPPGNGDGDNTPPGSGDGDNTPPGNGDGDNTPPGSGDGDNTPPGNGDGDNTPPGNGDGDNTPPGSGDGDNNTPPGNGDDDDRDPAGDNDDDNTPPGDGSGDDNDDDYTPPGNGSGDDDDDDDDDDNGHQCEEEPEEEVPVEDVADVCSGENENFRIVRTKKVLKFKECKNCNWNENGNLGKKNAFFQARNETVKKIKIPENAILCGMEIKTLKHQKVWYDDHFILSLNDVAIASTESELVNMLRPKGDNLLPAYDWMDIVGNPWVNENNDNQQAFCLGQDSVRYWPKTDRWGEMNFSISSEEVMKITALDINRKVHELRFTTVGDNDKSDCRHSPLKFKVKVRYAIEKDKFPGHRRHRKYRRRF